MASMTIEHARSTAVPDEFACQEVSPAGIEQDDAGGRHSGA